mgnify:CR=1 FL=1
MSAFKGFQKNKWTKKIGSTVNSLSGFVFQNKEQSKVDELENAKTVLVEDIENAYKSIGRIFVSNMDEGKEHSEGTEGYIKVVKEKRSKIKEIEEQIIEIKKSMMNQTILKEKEELQKEFEKEKERFDEALKMELITQDEYQQKINERRVYIDHFDEIRRIKKQRDMNIISKEEMEAKIQEIISQY